MRPIVLDHLLTFQAAATPKTVLPLAVIFTMIAGMMAGSFLNVVIYRVPRGLSVNHPRSFCPRCSNPVAWFDNIPVVSWVLLRGKCRNCGLPISSRYPIFETIGGAVCLLILLSFGVHPEDIGLSVAALTCLAMVGIALDSSVPTSRVPAIGCSVAFVMLIASSVYEGAYGRDISGAIGLALAGIVNFALSVAASRSHKTSPAGAGACGGDCQSGACQMVCGIPPVEQAPDGLLEHLAQESPTLLLAGLFLGWVGGWPLAAGALVGVAAAILLMQPVAPDNGHKAAKIMSFGTSTALVAATLTEAVLRLSGRN
jgi:prepilin signal peptidase PulO-like enzyme (type II secretory pathway)